MRRGHGLFTTLLMIVPMVAVPVMAVFGVPQFVPQAVSSTQNSEPDFPEMLERDVEHSAALPARQIEMSATAQADLFQPYQAEKPQDVRQVAWQDPLGGKLHSRSEPTPTISTASHHPISSATMTQLAERRTTQHDLFADKAASEVSDEAGMFDSSLVSSELTSPARYSRQAGTRTAESVPVAVDRRRLTWQEASARLEELRIHQFDLVRGGRPGEFRFICLVTSDDDPRISRRFEAEAAEPLIAVERVLGQIEAWNQAQ